MPVIGELYQHDQSMDLIERKEKNLNEEIDPIFSRFVSEIEDSIQELDLTGCDPQVKSGDSSQEKE